LNISEETRQWFQIQSNENISTIIEEAIENQLNISCPILGITKQKNIIKIHHCMTDENADEVAQNMDWNTFIEGLNHMNQSIKL
jgi:hypothetical protein